MIEIEDIVRVHLRRGGPPVYALTSLTFSVQAGEFVTVRGASGSGKSSLLNILGCLDRPSAGRYRLMGQDVTLLSDCQLARVRSRQIGFIFQSFNLLPKTTAVENVEIPMVYLDGRVNRRRALEALDRVGLLNRAHHRSSELSGGEQQRVAVARALINNPPLILADEPTGNLDQAAGGEVMRILGDLNSEGRTIVLITHDEATARHAQRQIILRDGALISDERQTTASGGGSREVAS